MTLNQSALLELTDVLRTADGGQVMRLMLSAMLQALVDAEATAHIGAGPYEHTPTRTTQRNGTREKTVGQSGRERVATTHPVQDLQPLAVRRLHDSRRP